MRWKNSLLTLLALPAILLAAGFRINQVGYSAQGPKFAIFAETYISGACEVVDATTDEVAHTIEYAFLDATEDWSALPLPTSRIDFSELTKAGSYYLRAKNMMGTPFQSEIFVIDDHPLFDQTLALTLDYFYHSRANHPHVWQRDSAVGFYNAPEKGTRDVRGGWYDASGDLSKNLSHLNYGNFTMPQQIPMSAYIMTDLAERIPEQLGKLNILDKMRDEALWGADYLTRILDPEGYFYTNIFDNWTGLLNQREICAFEGSKDTLNLTWYPDFRVGTKTQDWQAAFREGAGVAIATLARISQWEQSGDSSSTAYLAAATKAWDHLASNNFANARAYADDKKLNIIDDITILLAATELWKATQKTTYLDEAETRVLALNERLHSEGYFIADDSDRPFYHAADAGLPIAALSRFLDVHPKSIYSILVKATIAQHLNYLIKVTKEIKNPYGYPRQHIKVDTIQTSFFIPQVNETGYWWQGENARLGSLAFAAIAGGRHLKGDTLTTLGVQPKYHDYAMTQLNWIMGQNPYDICFMAGIGYNNPLLYGDSTLYHGGLEGGISNGITSYQFDGGYITWNPSGSNEKWRWVRQWLPNAHWYMAAVGLTSQLSEAVNHPSTPTITESFALNFNVRVGSSHIELDWAKPNKSNAWKIYDLQGGLLAHGTTNDAQVSIPWNQKGIFLVQSNKKLRKFVYK